MRRFDPDDSGGIDFDEFQRFATVNSEASCTIAAQAQHLVADAEIERIIHHVMIGISNQSEHALEKATLKRVFTTVDKDGSGTISQGQFDKAMSVLGTNLISNSVR